jgi:hypothetical protein
MPAPLAGVSPLGFDLVPVRLALALHAHMALAIANIEDVQEAGFIGGELFEEVPNGDTRFPLGPLGLCHWRTV